MAIDIQQPNYSGLTAIAGKSAPLNLAPTGALGLQALQQQQANDAAMRASAMQRAQLQQQGQLALMSQGTQNRALDLQAQQQQRQGLLANNQLALQKQQMAQQGNQFNVENAMKQQQAAMGQDMNNAALEQASQQKEIEQLMKANKADIDRKGTLAAYGLVALKNAKTPEEAHTIRSEIINEAVSNKDLPPDAAKALLTAPLSTFQNFLTHQAMVLDSVGKFKDMMAANKSNAPVTGTKVSFNEDGSISEISVDPTSAVKTEAMKDVKNRELGLQQLASIRDKFDPKEFTYAGRAGRGAAAVAELSKGIPGVEQVTELAAKGLTGQSSEDRAGRLETATSYMNSIDQFFNTYRKEITGAAAAQKELDRLKASFINSELSPSQFKGSLDQLLKKYVGESEFSKNVLREGIDTAPRNLSKMSDAELDAEIARLGAK